MKSRSTPILLLLAAFSLSVILTACASSQNLNVEESSPTVVPLVFNISGEQEGTMYVLNIEHNLPDPPSYMLSLMVSRPSSGFQDRIDDYDAAMAGSAYHFYPPDWLLRRGGIVQGIISVPGHKGIQMPNSRGYHKVHFSLVVEPVLAASEWNKPPLWDIPRMQ